MSNDSNGKKPSSASEVKIRAREENLWEEWKDKSVQIPVNNQQYSFDSQERQDAFNYNLCVTDEERAQHKHYRSEWYRRAKEFDPGPAPLAVTCELVSNCNLSCSMCYTITEDFQSKVVGSDRMMALPIVKAVIDECAELGVHSMLFSWRGESTLYRAKDEDGKVWRFPDVLAYARKKGILEITSLTNGSLLTEEMCREIVEAQPSWISFSIDGMERAYNKIRTPKNKRGTDHNAFKIVTENIRTLVRIREEMGLKRPQIRTNTIYPAIHENPQVYHDFMENLGVGWVTVNELMDLREEYLEEDSINEGWACQYPFQRLTVAANGIIFPCTGAHDEQVDMRLGRYPGSRPKTIIKDGKKEIVDMPIKTLKEVWLQSKDLSYIRDMHKTGRRCEIGSCKHCEHGMKKKGATYVPKDWDLEEQVWRDENTGEAFRGFK